MINCSLKQSLPVQVLHERSILLARLVGRGRLLGRRLLWLRLLHLLSVRLPFLPRLPGQTLLLPSGPLLMQHCSHRHSLQCLTGHRQAPCPCCAAVADATADRAQPVLQYYDPDQGICVSTPSCFGGTCPSCTYLDSHCQCCKPVSGCTSPSPSGR